MCRDILSQVVAQASLDGRHSGLGKVNGLPASPALEGSLEEYIRDQQSKLATLHAEIDTLARSQRFPLRKVGAQHIEDQSGAPGMNRTPAPPPGSEPFSGTGGSY